MSLISDLKTFASKVEAEFVKLFKSAPSALQIASGVVTYATPLIVGLEAELLPAALPLTTSILNQIKSDLATLSAAVTSVNGSATAAQAVSSLQSSLPALLSSAKVENSSLVSKIEGVVTVISPELSALLTILA